MQAEFFSIADFLAGLLRGSEVYTCTFEGEESDFVRFNRSAVRQAGTVTQRFLTVDLIEGHRHATGELSLAGDAGTDHAAVRSLVERLREQRDCVPEDPHMLYSPEVCCTERVRPNRLPERGDALDAILSAGHGRDLVGIYAAGGITSGFANSLGQRNWHETYSFNLDWSFHHAGDKAVKASYAGFAWDMKHFDEKVARAAEQVATVTRPARTIGPGRYRVYLSPAALAEILGTVAWGGFGLRAHRTKETPLLRMIANGVRLHGQVTIRENTAQGVAPGFDAAGFVKPDCVTLIESGHYRDCLVSPRTGAEFDVPTNGASPAEMPESLDMAPGEVQAGEVLRTLDSGVYVGNLWYLNFSDRSACRITGMTRFGTFWVEGGAIRQPIQVMRFDESLERILGSKLVGLTNECELLLDPDTYSRRSLRSARLPGAIVDDFTFTL